MQGLMVQRVPTHILTGFLGAGKTTLLRHLLAQKPETEVWAVLMNEFGQIGLDGLLLDQPETGIAIREVTGGCLCCTSQLPMQIGLSRLLGQAKPDRLFIEPTGLGHPKQLVEQLTAEHWQQSLQLRGLVTVLDGSRLHDVRMVQHESFGAQLAIADVIAVSHQQQMQVADHTLLNQLLAQLPEPERQIRYMDHGELPLAAIDLPRRQSREVRRSLLHTVKQPQGAIQSSEEVTDIQLPYHYVESSLGQEFGGWRLPADWVFDRDQLLAWLLGLTDWQRIKGVIQVADGWVAINLIPNQVQLISHSGGIDNRLEIIGGMGVDWSMRERGLMACLRVSSYA
ncbi:MAG: GTP-binding protein [Pseudomonadota bacterium]|nr:GTP-binding protein [Pseudomonadota bacterium]